MKRGGSMLAWVAKPTRQPNGPGAVTMNIGYSRVPTSCSNASIGLVVDGLGDVGGPLAVGRALTAVPEPVVERPRRHAGALGELLAGVHGAGADLALVRAALGQLSSAVDARRELVVVVQDA